MYICKKCGNQNQDEDQFCASCGSFLEFTGERVAPAPPPPAPAPPPPPPPPPPGFVERVKQAVGMEGREQEPARGEGWRPPASVQSPPTPPPPPPVVGGAWVAPSASSSPPAPPAPPSEPVRAQPAQAQPASPAAPVTPPPPPPPLYDRPDARRPDALPPRPTQPPKPKPPPPPPEHIVVGIYCARCGTGNESGKHFCRRCGAPLGQTVQVRVPWYRRLFPGRRAPVAGDRPSGPGPSPGTLLRRFVLTVLVAILVVGAFGYAALPGFRAGVNQRVDRAVTEVRRNYLQPGYVRVHPKNTTASSELSGHPGSYAADEISNDYWAADTSRDHEPTLRFIFDGPTDVDALLITSGASGTDFAKFARPKHVQLTYSDGTGDEFTLVDDAKPTSYPIHARGTTTITMKITSVYPVSGNPAVGITEVEFFRLK